MNLSKRIYLNDLFKRIIKKRQLCGGLAPEMGLNVLALEAFKGLTARLLHGPFGSLKVIT